jgi:predicted RNA-binding Zn ribbon-like protein
VTGRAGQAEDLTTGRRTAALFVAGAPGLDFLNSIATSAGSRVDRLESGEGLVAWVEEAGLVPASALAEVGSRAVAGELDAAAAQARGLREWFRGFVQEHKGRPLEASALGALKPLNELLARDDAYEQLVHGRVGDGFERQTMRRWRSPDSLLLPIADALARLVSEEDFTHVKACEGAGCTLLFADHTRGHARRWCSMAICGNRAKAAAHRRRHIVHPT